jgi:hypothetical protein
MHAYINELKKCKKEEKRESVKELVYVGTKWGVALQIRHGILKGKSAKRSECFSIPVAKLSRDL